MAFPAFFAEVPRITVHDGLARLLGASDDGTIEYGYEDVVRLAGHSCPTVAGAWLMTLQALQALYPDGTPERGEIDVRFADEATRGVTGVIANVVGLVTGATTDTGFKGLAGRHDRRHLMHFNADIPGEITFTRRDTGAAVAVSFSAQAIPGSPEAMPLLQKMLSGQATEEEGRQFGALWQDRVRRILTAPAQAGLVTVSPLQAA
ncbi:FmdE family protein [Castellaniella sp.]|uniref:FmdE family protein n=1 Tax=Castellaniella sp. TaxID=1955812 RepID=UPI00355EAE68